MAAINSRLYRNTLELLRLYNSSTSFRNVFNRLLNRPRVYYKGIPLKTYVYTLTSLNHQYFYRFLKITPERINRLFTNFYINTGSRQALERSVTQYPLTENEILEHNELAGIEKLPEDEKKENFFDKFLEKNSQGEKTDEKKEEVKQPESQPQSTRATQFRQNLAARLKTFQTPNIIKNISSKGQIGARKLLSKLTPTQLASLGLGLTGGLLGLISNGSAGALIGGAAGAITPTLINKGYGQLAVQTAYVVGIRTSRALNSLNNIKLGLPGLTLAFKNPLLIVAIGAGLLLFILMPGGLLESSALLPSYTSLSNAGSGSGSTSGGSSGTGSGSGSGATGNLTITKTGPAAVNNGENITYQISVTYSGTGTADVEVADKLPSGTDFLSASDGGQNQSGTVKWSLTGITSTAKSITLVLKTTQSDVYVTNTAIAKITGTSGGGIIDVTNAKLADILAKSAQNANIPLPFLKAIAATEGQLMSYSEDEVIKFSTPGWWNGLRDNAPTLSQNDPVIIRGYGYNTCQYARCAPGANVRGVMQFELGTWNGVKGDLPSLGHDPDRRLVVDAIFGAAINIRNKATRYGYSLGSSWDENTVRAMARSYCGGSPSASMDDPACKNGDLRYDDIVWRYYQQFK